MIEIKNLYATVDGKEILKGFDLTINAGEVHAIMGPNGSGKSTLSYILAGRDGYEVTQGDIMFNGQSILDMSPEQRAAMGLFLAFQYPVEIAGVPTQTFLKTMVDVLRAARGQEAMKPVDFLRLMREKTEMLDMAQDMLKRNLNEGFSGGEKKRNEVLQMILSEPQFVVMDETDSGLDIDALRIVAQGVNSLRNEARGFLIITHYQRLLDYIRPDVVHIMADGRIQKTGDFALVEELEKKGYAEFINQAA